MADTTGLVALPGSDREPVAGAKVIAPAPPGDRLQVTVRVRPKSPLPDPSGFAVGTIRPHFSHAALDEAHGADPKDLDAVAAFARGAGLTVVEESAPTKSVFLDGTVEAFEKAFGVTLSIYEYPEGTYRGRVGSIYVPADLAGIVDGVFGLDNRPFATPRHHRRRASPRASTPATFDANKVAALYDFPSDVDGTGQCIGIIELAGGYRPGDLTAYFDRLGLPTPTVLPVAVGSGNNAPRDDGASVEVTLDIEVAGAVAPGAKIAVYFAPDATDQSFLDAMSKAVHDEANSPSVISISWGGPESGPTNDFVTQFDQALQAAALLGITVCCAAGDDGAADTGPSNWDGKARVDFPASSPHVLACGGTTLTAAGGSIVHETVWNEGFADTADDTFAATGGGISEAFTPPPSWQASVSVPASPNTGKAGRGVPDVAGDADGATGYNVTMTLSGKLQTFAVGGTSAVAPLWAGLVALLNQKLGRRVGFLNPSLYALPSDSGAFRDVTSGNNRVGDAKVGYDAAVGWDPCTGLGTPDGAKLLAALSALITAAPPSAGDSGSTNGDGGSGAVASASAVSKGPSASG